MRNLLPMARPLVLYDAWRGRYTDSPRAIHEELLRRDAPFEHVWVISPGNEEPPGATYVAPHSRDHLAALARARHLVVNDLLPLYYVKAPGVTVTQTWHGTPLKRIGLDVLDPTYPHARRYRWHLRRNSRLWDHVVSQNSFSTPILRRAFAYRGSILEVGYPRNDSLVREPCAPDGAVLFAPTWRDSGRRAALAEDVRTLADAIGPTRTLLLRLHKHEVDALRGAALPANVRDVSAHGHVNDLMARADALVTDYSSIMFDFAVTGRPIVLHVPDLEQYRDVERGFCFDLLAEAPGPVERTIDAVAAALEKQLADGVDAERYDRFRATFAPLDDGRAAARVVEAVFGH